MELGDTLTFKKQFYTKTYGKIFPKTEFTIYEITQTKVRCIDEDDIDITIPLVIFDELAKICTKEQ